MAYSEAEGYVNSLVGEGSHFRGHLELAGLLRIDGDFSGSVRTTGKVLVGKNGRADCEIEAGTVVVAGVFRGTIYSTEKVIVLSSAMVLGKVYAPRLIAEEGVILDGEFRIRADYGAVHTPKKRDSFWILPEETAESGSVDFGGEGFESRREHASTPRLGWS
jgi:cytoskeletal protein CcmA (bactofilin family)